MEKIESYISYHGGRRMEDFKLPEENPWPQGSGAMESRMRNAWRRFTSLIKLPKSQ